MTVPNHPVTFRVRRAYPETAGGRRSWRLECYEVKGAPQNVLAAIDQPCMEIRHLQCSAPDGVAAQLAKRRCFIVFPDDARFLNEAARDLLIGLVSEPRSASRFDLTATLRAMDVKEEGRVAFVSNAVFPSREAGS